MRTEHRDAGLVPIETRWTAPLIHGFGTPYSLRMAESAGLLLFRRPPLRVLIAHPGGPFWKGKHEGAWSIPKGLVESGEEPIDTARREFVEETGLSLPESATPIELGSITLRSGKRVTAWCLEADVDVALADFGTFRMEWPPKSGIEREFPEIDELRWVDANQAAELLNPAQVELVERLVALLG